MKTADEIFADPLLTALMQVWLDSAAPVTRKQLAKAMGVSVQRVSVDIRKLIDAGMSHLIDTVQTSVRSPDPNYPGFAADRVSLRAGFLPSRNLVRMHLIRLGGPALPEDTMMKDLPALLRRQAG